MHRPFGTTGRDVVVIGQGTWQMETDARAGAIEAIRAGIDAGLTHIDTAEMYGSGRVEEIVGEALHEGGAALRDRVTLVSKVLPSNASRRGVIAACETSLKKLGTDRLDVYLLHWPGSHPLADTIAAFEELVAAGKIGAWGVSNFDRRDLERALAICGPGKIACNQVLYHLEERAIEREVIPWCRANGVAIVGYSPFGSGSFPSPRSAGGKVLAQIAADIGKSPRQVALAFLVRGDGLFTIPKSSRKAHVLDNAGALGLELSEAHVRAISDAFPLSPPGPLPMI